MTTTTFQPRLRGPTGVRVALKRGWAEAYVQGVPMAGLRFREANRYPDGGRRWLIGIVAVHWSDDVAAWVHEGGVTVDE